MNTNHSPFLQEASGLVEVRFALLQDEKEFAGKRRRNLLQEERNARLAYRHGLLLALPSMNGC